MQTTRLQSCRICSNACPIVVDIADGRAVRVRGDRESPLYHGYICPKGRALPRFHNDSRRTLRAMKRSSSGELAPIPLAQAVDEIAGRLEDLLTEHGPRSVVAYAATGIQPQVVVFTMLGAFLQAIGSPWPAISAYSIDQAGKAAATALHGRWMAPKQGFDDPDVALLVGINPLVSHIGVPFGSPVEWLRERKAAGMRLIVVDPRRSETAHHADIHLQPRPGTDVELLAAMVHVILDEHRHDKAFVEAHTVGFDSLRAAVRPYAPGPVAAHTEVAVDDLIRAARLFADARRGYAVAGTAANMTGRATLNEYLVLCLTTLCGRWLRAGERVRAAPSLMRPRTYREQAISPPPPAIVHPPLHPGARAPYAPDHQITDLVDDMASERPDRIRALLCMGGNPAAAWPDQHRVVAALRRLELLVVADPVMTSTAALAHYVIPPKMLLEVPAATTMQDFFGADSGSGYADSFAQYVPAVLDPPPGSECIEEWEFLYEVAKRMGRTLRIGRTELDPERRPTTDELLAVLTKSARVPLDEVKRHPHGARFPDDTARVQPAEPGSDGRLDLGSAPMMDELAEVAGAMSPRSQSVGAAFRLIVRRMLHVQNSMLHGYSDVRPPYNPAFLHPDDLASLGVHAGDPIEITSANGSIVAVAESDPGLRRGLVSISHGFGTLPPGRAADSAAARRAGANTGVLIDVDDGYDRISGQPRMSNIEVSVRRHVERDRPRA